MSTTKLGALDVISIGRSSVDLYGQQIGSRLEDIASFSKSVGGCPANIAIGTARLGLKSGLITAVGNEQMGRFIIEQCVREGVSTYGIKSDPHRLTALVLLAVEDEDASPMIFYRQDCADMGIDENDIDEDFIRSARSILVSGTHFSQPNTENAQLKAMRIAKANGIKIIFDIDYRPNLWGLAGHEAGFERYVKSTHVSNKLSAVLSDCDLIVGTEEEMLIASGQGDLLQALKTIRTLSHATIVLKRGPKGCIVYEGEITGDLENGIVGAGFPIEVFNVLGAGDAFMSGFLRGWLKGEDHETCATWANACGAFAVSRLLCSPEYATWEELTYFLQNGSKHTAIRKDEDLNHIHWATTRRSRIPSMMAFAIDHRSQLTEIADRVGADRSHIEHFKVLAVKAAGKVSNGRPGYGMLLDETYGRLAMFEASKHKFDWIARPVERPGTRPLRFEFSQDIGSELTSWPLAHTIKCLCFYHPDDTPDLKEEQQAKLRALFDAARKVGRELLIEIIAGKHGTFNDGTVARALSELYALGIRPDWWKLEPQPNIAAWHNIEAVINEHDPHCRGVVLLGLDAPQAELEDAFAVVADINIVKGFAIGRTIFSNAAEQWLSGTMSDQDAITDMALRFENLTVAWQRARCPGAAKLPHGSKNGEL